MTFKELLLQVQFDNVWEELIKAYPDQSESELAYKKVFCELLLMEPVQKDAKWKIVIQYIDPKKLHEERCETIPGYAEKYDNEEYEDEEGWYDVSGAKVYDRTKTKYGIEFTPWEEWLAMSIDKKSLKNFTKEQIAAHCLWEMTFCGYDNDDVKEQAEALNEICKEIDEAIKSGDTSKFKTFDEVMEELKMDSEDIENEVEEVSETAEIIEGTVYFRIPKKNKEDGGEL